MAFKHRDVIRCLGGPRTVASSLGLGYYAVRSWEARNSIPGRYWPAIAELAAKAGVWVTAADLAEAAPARKPYTRKADAICVGAQVTKAAPLEEAA